MFWTVPVPASSVRVSGGASSAILEAHDVVQKDYGEFLNTIVPGGPPPTPGRASFKVVWTADGPVTEVDNPAQQYRASFRTAIAQMEWSARTPDYEFQSAPLDTSVGDASQIGHESNGSYY